MTLASLPAASAELPQASLALSEVLPNPGGNLTEAESEWTEVLVLRAGDAGGWSLTDFDGEADFVFPAMQVAEGERLVIANGETRPAGAPSTARVLFAGKSWWTFDNAGDEVALLRPDGSMASALSWGEGSATEAALPNATRLEGPLFEGASLVDESGTARLALPTPGSTNRALVAAPSSGLRLAGFVGGKGAMAAVVCGPSNALFLPFLWRVEAAGRSEALGSEPWRAGSCATVGAALSAPLLARAEAELEVAIHASALVRSSAWNASTEVSIVDPWGEEALRFEPPEASFGGPAVWTPCECPAVWQAVALSPLPNPPAMRAVGEVQVLRAGDELAIALHEFMGNASRTLSVNSYLLTSPPVQSDLAEASRRGVTVRVLLEGAPAGGIQPGSALLPDAVEAWNASGVAVRAFNTTAPNADRDHAKYLVADEEDVLVLTENLVGSALSEDDPNTGYALQLRSPALAADLLAVFDWDFAMARSVSNATLRTPLSIGDGAEPFGSGEARAAVLTSPEAGEGLWVATIDAASSHLALETLSAAPEVLGPAGPLGAALLRACARGVRVEVLLAGPIAGADGTANQRVAEALASAASAEGCASSLEARIDVRAEESRSVLHAKVLVADERTAIVGSHNLVSAAFRSNREVSLMLDDPRSSKNLSAFLASDFARGRPVRVGSVSFNNTTPLGEATIAPAGALSLPPSLSITAVGFAAAAAALFRRRRFVRDRTARPPPPADLPPEIEVLASNDPLMRGREPPPAPSREPPFNPRAEPAEISPVPPRPFALPPSALELFEGR